MENEGSDSFVEAEKLLIYLCKYLSDTKVSPETMTNAKNYRNIFFPAADKDLSLAIHQ
jgi:hypothetical protein